MSRVKSLETRGTAFPARARRVASLTAQDIRRGYDVHSAGDRLQVLDLSGLYAMRVQDLPGYTGNPSNPYRIYADLNGAGKTGCGASVGGNGLVYGGAGADAINAGAGKDTVFAGSGDDLAAGYDGDDFIDGGAGNDIVYGGGQADILFGGQGNDQLAGGDGDDLLAGEDEISSDTVSQLTGDDTLSGGAGNDTLLGALLIDYAANDYYARMAA